MRRTSNLRPFKIKPKRGSRAQGRKISLAAHEATILEMIENRTRQPSQTTHERTILDVIEQLLPKGTRRVEPAILQRVDPSLERKARVLLCPEWPADVFAVAATLMELSGGYAEATLVDGHFVAHSVYLKEVRQAANEWKTSAECPDAVQGWWTLLVTKHGMMRVEEIGESAARFCPIVSLLMRLLAAADEASAGVGWIQRGTARGGPARSVVVDRVQAALLNQRIDGPPAPDGALPHLPGSICVMVPPNRATVLPKALTPSVGCTIRAMSHNLALLPPSSVVQAQWVLADNGPSSNTMRLLVIPYPFRVDDESFVASGPARALGHGATMQPYFAVSPTWLSQRSGEPVTAEMLRDELVEPLICSAEKKFGRGAIDAVLFPECALTESLADELLEQLRARPIAGLKFMIAGTLAAGAVGTTLSDGKPGRNRAKTALFRSGAAQPEQRIEWDDAHAKHHRWALDEAQIKRYGLTGVTAPHKAKVWEHMAVEPRKLPFLALRDDLCMTVLICEDLARADPAMPVVRAVGPNLVVALLMDGPQLASRWPGRYATVLAEDPGSSVLSITSAGMVDRSNLGERAPARAVALWRHASGYNTELYLPLGHHGLVLTVKADKDEQFSLDHRSDRTETRRWTLETVTPLAVKADWLD